MGLVDKCVVFYRRREDRRQIISCLKRGRFQTGDVIVVAEYLVRLVLRDGSRRARRAPWHRSMVGALGPDDGLSAGMGPGDHQGHQGGVGAVLAEHRPVGVSHHGNHGLGQFDHHPAGAGHGVAASELVHEGAVNFLVAIADQVRSIGAHEVEQFVAVRIP